MSSQWRKQALCVGLDIAMFYPEKQGRKAEGVTLCLRCPVRVDCLAYVLDAQIYSEDYGVWGGTTPKQRRPLRVAKRSWSRDELEIEIERIDSGRLRVYGEDRAVSRVGEDGSNLRDENMRALNAARLPRLTDSPSGFMQRERAAMCDVSVRAVAAAQVVVDHGDGMLIEAVESGVIGVRAAERRIRRDLVPEPV